MKLLFAMILCAAALPCAAQLPAGDFSGGANNAVSASVAPAEVREVVAEGRAAITPTGGVLAARKAAEAQALRSAVEKTLGVFVSARTLTHNYVLVRDQVTTRAEGFATLKEIVGENITPGEVRVTVRALVSLRPLAQQLKALNLTRAWRVFVVESAAAAVVETTLEKSLTDAGFVVVSSAKEADVLVRVSPQFAALADTPLDTAAGPMTMHSVRSEVGIRATRAGTGEVVAALSAGQTALHINTTTAQTEAAGGATRLLAPRLVDALLLLPARDAQFVALTVSGLTGGASQVGRLEEALNTLPGVKGVTRRGFAAKTASWEVEVAGDTASALARALEEDASVRSFHLRVQEETRAKITAMVAASVSARPKNR